MEMDASSNTERLKIEDQIVRHGFNDELSLTLDCYSWWFVVNVRWNFEKGNDCGERIKIVAVCVGKEMEEWRMEGTFCIMVGGGRRRISPVRSDDSRVYSTVG